MITIEKVLPRHQKLAKVLLDKAPKLVLKFEDRQKSRQRVRLDNHEEAGLFLTRGTVLRGGDILVTTAGQFVQVVAAEESVMQVSARPESATPAFDLLRAAYHLGNRHIPVEIGVAALKLEQDHVLQAMLQGLGLTVTLLNAPFEPEGGAYDHETSQHHGHHHYDGHDCAHDHHDHEHAHAQGHLHAPQSGKTIAIQPAHVHDEHCQHEHPHQPDAKPEAKPTHVHGPGCGHHH